MIALFDANKLTDDWLNRSRLLGVMRALTGRGARNCGHVQTKGDPRLATDCALNAYQQGESFYVQYEITGIDVQMAVGIAFDGSTVYKLTSNSGPLRFWQRDNVSADACSSPAALVRTEDGQLDCD